MNYSMDRVELEDLEDSIDSIISLYNEDVDVLPCIVSEKSREELKEETKKLRIALIALSHFYTERSLSEFKSKMRPDWKNISIDFNQESKAVKQTK